MNEIRDYSYTQNRELSWLRFNERVLEEAIDSTVPLFERMKFVSIFMSNLDEFFMIRVGSISDLLLFKNTEIDKKTGMNPREQLDAIYKETQRLIPKKDRIFFDLNNKLKEKELYFLKPDELSSEELKKVSNYFKKYIKSVLSPQIIGSHHPFPHLENLRIHLALQLERNGQKIFAIVPMPNLVPRIFYLNKEKTRFILVEDIVKSHIDEVFDKFKILNSSKIIITRNGDINTEDGFLDEDIDYRIFMKKILKKRDRLAPVRLEYSEDINRETKEFLLNKLELNEKQSFSTKSPMDLSFVFEIEEEISPNLTRELLNKPFESKNIVLQKTDESIKDLIKRRDLLLHYPYEDIDLFLRWIKEASRDKKVLSIHITIYRLARNSKLIEYLIQAAENGKEVVVLMELRARFDEENNINWSEELIEAGCKVFYGFDEYKTHSKLCLITYIEDDQLYFITQIGTGNYNESTSKLYTDLSLITANQEIGQDAHSFFTNMMLGISDGKYDLLLTSPYRLKNKILDFIDIEIEKAKKGEKAYMAFKLNSLTDIEIIDKLAEASIAGVKIDMIIRGISCILPGVKNKTENISLRSIVGRYLEHSRIYIFGAGEEQKIYISSADFMTRNMEKRIEIAVPVLDEIAKTKILAIVEDQLNDNLKARLMDSKGIYQRIEKGESLSSTQDNEMMIVSKLAEELKKEIPKERKTETKRFLFGNIFKRKK